MGVLYDSVVVPTSRDVGRGGLVGRGTNANLGGADLGERGRGVFVAKDGENVRGGGEVGYTWDISHCCLGCKRLSSGLVVELVMPARRLFYWRDSDG